MRILSHRVSREQADVALFVIAAAAQRIGPMLILPLLLAHLTLAEYGTFALVQSAIALLTESPVVTGRGRS